MDILEDVLDEFKKLAAIPRANGHEQAISNFLKGYLAEQGFDVHQDKVGNIIADAVASPGYESAPLTILQGHMDMVAVAEEGYPFDPLKDAIKLKRSEKYLEAEGTSLGADDGIGVAEGIYLLKHAKNHGPLRLIVTVDEEKGMKGAINLETKYLRDAAYLINCDSEDYDILTVGSAGSRLLRFEKTLQWNAPAKQSAFHLVVSGLKGGHSGECAGEGRGNAIRTLALALSDLQQQGKVELFYFAGGKAHNAIPNTAQADFVTDLQENQIRQVLEREKESFLKNYGDADPVINYTIQSVPVPEKVLEANITDSLISFLTVFHTGVYQMSVSIPGQVETSANIGLVHMTDTELGIEILPRSAKDGKIEEFVIMSENLARAFGFSFYPGELDPAWTENKDSWLAKIMPEIFEKQNGKPMKVETIHAGLECGYHYEKNPNLDMVSIGVTTEEIHSPRERLVLATVKPQIELIEATLTAIAER